MSLNPDDYPCGVCGAALETVTGWLDAVPGCPDVPNAPNLVEAGVRTYNTVRHTGTRECAKWEADRANRRREVRS